MIKLSVLLGTCLVFFSLVGCGSGDTQKQVDDANNNIRRSSEIQQTLSNQGIYLSNTDYSERVLARKTPEERAKYDDLLQEFIARGTNVVATGTRDDVTTSPELLPVMRKLLANATRLHQVIKRQNANQ